MNDAPQLCRLALVRLLSYILLIKDKTYAESQTCLQKKIARVSMRFSLGYPTYNLN